MKRSHFPGYRRFLAQVLLCFWAAVGFAQDDSYRFTTLTSSADTWYATAVAAKADGTVYFSERSKCRIRQLSPAGQLSALVGDELACEWLDGSGTAAHFTYPQGLALAGNTLYAVDAGVVSGVYYHGVRQVLLPGLLPSTTVATLAGGSGQIGHLDAVGTAAQFKNPYAVAVDAAGNVYVAESAYIRKIAPDGTVTTLAGTGAAGTKDGVALTEAKFSGLTGIAVDAAGNVYVTGPGEQSIRKVSVAGMVTTLAGPDVEARGYTTGAVDGTGNAARFNAPSGLALNSQGELLVVDGENYTLRKVTVGGVVTTIAGAARSSGNADGVGSAARFAGMGGICVDAYDNIYLVANNAIRKGQLLLRIAQEASAQTVRTGGSATFAVTARAGAPVAYQWQVLHAPVTNLAANMAADAAGWTDLTEGGAYTGTQTASLTVAGITTAQTGDQYRCVASDGLSDTVYSQAATLTVDTTPALEIAKQPVSTEVVAGNLATFTVTATGGTAPLTYRWQVSTDSGGSWANLTDDTTYAGSATDTLTVTTALAMNGLWYRCVVEESLGSMVSTMRAFLTVLTNEVAPAIATQPMSRVAQTGQTVQFTLVASGSNPAYRWQRLANDKAYWDAVAVATTRGTVQYTGTWVNLDDGTAYTGTQTSTLTVTAPVPAMAGDRFRCVVTNTQGSVTSNDVRLSLIASTTPATSAGPLIKTTWRNAQWPLNAYYPVDPAGGSADLGYRLENVCGPSSITRLLRYREFPRHGAGQVSFTGASSFNSGKLVTWQADFAAADYLYDRMPLTLPATATEAVYGPAATLCLHAAAAMEDEKASGMDIPWLRRMFVKYFRYAPQAYEACRWQYSRAEWIALLKSELDAGRPILVMGRTATSSAPWIPGNFDGHWFIVDGYNSQDKFHYDYGYSIPHPDYCDVDDIGDHNSYHRVLIGLEPDFQGKTLELTAPVTDAAIRGGAATTIRWTSSGIDQLKIEYSADAGYNWTTVVAATPASAGSFSWTVPGTVTAQARLRLSDTTDENIYRRSGDFEVYAQKGLHWSSNLAGSVLQSGQSCALSWTCEGVRSMKIEYSADGGGSWITVADAVSTLAGSYTWTVPATATTQGRLRLSDVDDASVQATSGQFAITSLAIRAQPQSFAAVAGSRAVFEVSATGPASITYQWQVSSDAEANWANVDEGATYTGVRASILQVNATAAVQGCRYRCILSDGTVNSRVTIPATLTLAAEGTYVFETFAGRAGVSACVDGDRRQTMLAQPQSLAVDSVGNLYVADQNNSVIRRISPDGTVSVWAGQAGVSGVADGAASEARFDRPYGLAIDAADNVYVADMFNCTIRKITPGGVVSTLAGSADQEGATDGAGAAARFRYPRSLALDAAGNLYVADTDNFLIRQVTPAGVVTTLAGMAQTSGTTDGVGSAARFNYTAGITCDAANNLYVTEEQSHSIRKLTKGSGSTWTVSTYAGVGGSGGTVNGDLTSARFTYPSGVGRLASGDLLVAEDMHTLRRLSAAGQVTTLAGAFWSAGSADGEGSVARFNRPHGLLETSDGSIYVADSANHTIRRGIPCRALNVALGIATQPVASAVETGKTATFTVAATGGTAPLTYRWQVSTNGGTSWSDLANDATYTGALSNTLSVATSTALTGYQYRCIVSDAKGLTQTTTGAILTVADQLVAPAITTQPLSRVAKPGQAIQFSLVATGTGPAYRWQRLANDKAYWDAVAVATTQDAVWSTGTWVNLDDGPAYTGTQTSTLTVNSPAPAMAGDRFRCVVTNALGSATSSGVRLSLLASTTPATSAGPLIKTTWNNYQWPLNAYYPLDPAGGAEGLGYRIGNACGPSSITRILRFWEYPRRGAGGINFTAGNGAHWQADFSAADYLYDRMPYDLPSTADEATYGPTATLSFHAAAAMEDWGGSGMDTQWLRRMFVNNFRYAPQAYEACRWQYSRAEWIALLKSELDAGHPLLVMARSADSPAPWQPGNFDGHWFVIDGYNREDKFHYAYGYSIPNPEYCDVDDIGHYNSYHSVLIGLVPDAQGKTLELTAPFVGDAWKGGDNTTIRWASTGIDKLKIEYSTDAGANWSLVATDVPAASGSYVWTVPAVVTKQAKLRISDTTDENIYRKTAGTFDIYAQKTLQWGAELTGAVFQAGATFPLRWASEGVRWLKIEYSANGGSSWSTLANDVSTANMAYTWTVPALATAQARLRLSDAEAPTILATTGDFTVTTGEAVDAYHAADADTVVLHHFENDFVDAAGVVGQPARYGTLTFADGANRLGQALHLDNSASCGNALIWSANTALAVSGNWTIEAWVKVNSINAYTQYPWIIHAPANGWADWGLAFGLNPESSSFELRYKTAAGKTLGWASVGTYALGQWYHLALVGNATTGTLTAYVHDAQRQLVAKQQTTASADDLALWNTGQDVFIGGTHYASSNVQFDGWIDELRIVKRAVNYETIPVAPKITTQPTTKTITAGAAATFSVTATSTLPLTYQWQVSINGGTTWAAVANGTVYSGVGTDTLTVLKPTAVMKGYQYRCVITDGMNPAVTTTAATLTVQWSQFSALSARAPVGTGAQSLFMGFVYAGGGKATVVRGVGPGLLKNDTSLNAAEVLADPLLTLQELQTVNNETKFVAVSNNDNWGGGDALRTKMSALGMGVLDDDSNDAVLSFTPTRTVYTAQVSGVGDTTGLALAEAYDADFDNQAKRFTALSVRNHVGTGAAQLIVGFVIGGDAPKKVIIRGVGPGLVPAVSANDILADPTLQVNQLKKVNEVWQLVTVGTNDNWGGTADLAALMQQAGMGSLTAGSKDAVLVLELQPGVYTVQLTGVGETTGVGSVEIYEAP